MRTAYWMTKATETHSEYVTRIAFPLQQWLHGKSSMLRYQYTACLVQYQYEYFLHTVLVAVHFISYYS